jgi:hypothetical protein
MGWVLGGHFNDGRLFVVSGFERGPVDLMMCMVYSSQLWVSSDVLIPPIHWSFCVMLSALSYVEEDSFIPLCWHVLHVVPEHVLFPFWR